MVCLVLEAYKILCASRDTRGSALATTAVPPPAPVRDERIKVTRDRVCSVDSGVQM